MRRYTKNIEKNKLIMAFTFDTREFFLYFQLFVTIATTFSIFYFISINHIDSLKFANNFGDSVYTLYLFSLCKIQLEEN